MDKTALEYIGTHAKSGGQTTGPFCVAVPRRLNFILALEKEKSDWRTDILTEKETQLLAD